MKLSEVKNKLSSLDRLHIIQANGLSVPSHFHVTEVGMVNKKFIDCGGVKRHEQKVNFQLWEANDYDHRLHPEKLIKIIELSERELNLPDLEVEVEYQGDTIGKYGLAFEDGSFHLVAQQTDCLAKDNCGIPQKKPKKQLADLGKANACAPDSGCC